jgi:ABC-2 type transport system ATP-binding protein
MLKTGRIVALETTRELLRRIAGVQVSMRLHGTLPPALRNQVIAEESEHIVLRLGSADDVGPALEACRDLGGKVDELEVGPADLEDVFLQVMSEGAPDSRVRSAA